MSVFINDTHRTAEFGGPRKNDEMSQLTASPPKRQQFSTSNIPVLGSEQRTADIGETAVRNSRRFSRYSFRFGRESYAYRLYVPDASALQSASDPRPLVVLLHGCQQDSADFAQGTGMNRLAQRHQCLVLYPEQPAKSNHMRCWNWYDRGHQSRDAGEPAMLAALTRHVLKTREGDATRVYIGGLSAGGAMAALVAQLYPERFAAAGVHSGLAAGAAGNLMSAVCAMCHGAPVTEAATTGAAVPTIVFHGSDDRTVHPSNGEQVVHAAVAGLGAAGVDLVKSSGLNEDNDGRDAPRRTQRTRYSAADGIAHVEHWAVDAGPHAWFGGHPAGSFTDPQGPGASEAMLRFFLQHRNFAAVSAAAEANGAPS